MKPACIGLFLQLICVSGVFILVSSSSSEKGINHVHYIAAVEIEWDYAPAGVDQVYKKNSNAEFYIRRGAGRIGSKYRKAVYREYTDSTFSQQKPHPEWLGVMGPIIRAEIHDTITVHFKNLASRPYSINVNGGLLKDNSSTRVYYADAKKYEGALYNDGSKENFKRDDSVPPGGEYTYIWKTTYDDEHDDFFDELCVPRLYQSHVDAVRDVESGLLGVVMICNKELYTKGWIWERTGKLNKTFILLWKIFDENLSWYLDENIQKYSEKSVVNKEDTNFKQSNSMHAVNGYVFGNLPGLEMCKNDFIGWSIVGYGSKFNVHSVNFHGHSLVRNGDRTNMLDVYPLQSLSSRMFAMNPGKWLIRCEMHEHYKAGMQAFFTVKECNKPPPKVYPPTPVKDVEWSYYIAAEEVVWDYAPSGINKMTGLSLTQPGTTAEKYFSRTGAGLGGQYKKARYVEYTDASFSVKKTRDASEKHMGLLGPVIKATVGSKIKVVFKNLASRPYSIHPEGVFYDKSNEGMLYEDGTSGIDKKDDAVPPGETYVYRWTVPDPYYHIRKYSESCMPGIYHSGVNPVRDIHSGLVGAILICKEMDMNKNTGKVRDRDKEFYLHFSVIDETQSWYIDENIRTYSRNRGAMQINSPGFRESNLKHNINGYMFGNMPMLEMKCRTEKNAVHILSTGGDRDLFTVEFHGENLVLDQLHRNLMYTILQPGQSRSLTLVPYNEGEWAIIPGKFSYFDAGMTGKYHVSSCSSVDPEKMKRKKDEPYDLDPRYERIYYIAAVELEWDYAPNNINIITGGKLSEPDSPGYMYVTHDNNRLGSKYKKAVYREYEDETFTKLKERSAQDEHLGILGPVIKGGAGDTIIVIFKNMASRPYSIHPVGIITNKTDDGFEYSDGTSGESKLDNAVAPGKVHTYKWYLPGWATPDFLLNSPTACFSSVYHSAVNSMKDVHSGLVGPLYICRDDILDANLTFKQYVKKEQYFEHFLLFAVFDENLSWYFEENAKNLAKNLDQIDYADLDFRASNKMHAINGYIFGNMPSISQDMYSSSAFYLMSVGSQEDIHVAHINNLPLTDNRPSTWFKATVTRDGIPLFPGASLIVKKQYTPFLPGRWLIRCAVNEHFQAGMMALLNVTDPFADDYGNFKSKHRTSHADLPVWALTLLTMLALFVVIGLLYGAIKLILLKRRQARRASAQARIRAGAAAIPLNA